MKFLFLLLSFSTFANEFQLKDTGARFTLKITPTEVSYDSEALTKRIPIRDCARKLAVGLNTELFSKVPESVALEGLTFLIDKRERKIPLKSEFTKSILMMDARMMRFFVEEKSACR